MVIETAGPIPKGVTSDSILRVINRMVAPQKLQFLAGFCSASGRITLETGPTTSAEMGVALRQEIYQGLDALNIEPTNIFANSRWTKWVIHGVPSEVGTTNTVATCTCLALKIQQSTGVILAQVPRWLTRPDTLNETGQGTIIVSLPGNVVNIGANSMTLFNRRCRWEKARPDRRNAECFRCPEFGHHQEKCEAPPKCGICAESHPITDHKYTTASCPGAPNAPTPHPMCQLPPRAQRTP